MDKAIPAWRQVSGATLKTGAEKKVLPAVRAIGVLFLALAAGCAGVTEAPPRVIAQTGPVIVDPSPVAPTLEVAVAAEPPRSETIRIEPVASAPTPETPPAKSQSAAKAAPPPAKAPAKVLASPVAIEQPRKIEDLAPVARKLEPPLDVAGLTARLRDTNAIGVFTKLALKNQVDDLLKQFRAHYQSGQKTSVTSLRQPYDMLVLKVLSLVQDRDPPLARTISGSREAIWGILADREKFNSVI
ncbi:MAG: hypothetical protein AABM33_05810 [Pseudomonadota bacterium]